ncbi:hypothetical protein CFter6_4750 [Collimonas fungivorans]|uniref:Uncharacterized protein n=1 Tax=Collimonas fungivorans TaxID=158899 RepID=A0A127PIS0_9BURK|nr:hypothetical protein CFter6_4750 [Collimonas fungivorans]
MGTADYSSAQSTLLALMNSAPAELLHPLIDAALQPLLVKGLFPASGPGKGIRITCRLRSLAKKTPAAMPASEFCYKTVGFSKENAAKPDRIGVSGDNR